jgi:LmbE family N-acetylglucosaminyl deacetylase
MKKNKFYTGLFTTIFFLSILSACKREDVTQYAPIENFPLDTILQTMTPKKAMIVIAHDDDMCAMTGTISMLNKKGWKIRVLSIPKGDSRNRAHRNACKNILDSVIFFHFTESEFRIDSNTIKYDAVPKSQFSKMFKRSLVKRALMEEVNKFQPSVIFTLDNEIGGYGHPEHVFISQLVLDLAQTDSISTNYIYQSVYTDHMETSIMTRHSRRMKSWGFPGDGWDKAKLAYGVDGMPAPSVQINIRTEAKAKMNYLKSYNERERKTMGFFVPAFEDYTAEEYFTIFDREFYRVISINQYLLSE